MNRQRVTVLMTVLSPSCIQSICQKSARQDFLKHSLSSSSCLTHLDFYVDAFIWTEFIFSVCFIISWAFRCQVKKDHYFYQCLELFLLIFLSTCKDSGFTFKPLIYFGWFFFYDGKGIRMHFHFLIWTSSLPSTSY